MFTVVVRCSAECLAINGFSQEDEEDKTDREKERKGGVEAEEDKDGPTSSAASPELSRTPVRSAGGFLLF